jgi:hypothetical protein
MAAAGNRFAVFRRLIVSGAVLFPGKGVPVILEKEAMAGHHDNPFHQPPVLGMGQYRHQRHSLLGVSTITTVFVYH